MSQSSQHWHDSRREGEKEDKIPEEESTSSDQKINLLLHETFGGGFSPTAVLKLRRLGLSEGFLSHPTWFPFRVSCSFPYNTL